MGDIKKPYRDEVPAIPARQSGEYNLVLGVGNGPGLQRTVQPLTTEPDTEEGYREDTVQDVFVQLRLFNRQHMLTTDYDVAAFSLELQSFRSQLTSLIKDFKRRQEAVNKSCIELSDVTGDPGDSMAGAILSSIGQNQIEIREIQLQIDRMNIEQAKLLELEEFVFTSVVTDIKQNVASEFDTWEFNQKVRGNPSIVLSNLADLQLKIDLTIKACSALQGAFDRSKTFIDSRNKEINTRLSRGSNRETQKLETTLRASRNLIGDLDSQASTISSQQHEVRSLAQKVRARILNLEVEIAELERKEAEKDDFIVQLPSID